MSDPGKKPPISVYDAYEAVKKCALAYYEMSRVVIGYHRVSPSDARVGDGTSRRPRGHLGAP